MEQALRAQLYPASIVDPSTFATFAMLRQFHVLTLQSKIAAYDYHESISKLTDATGTLYHYVRTSVFLRARVADIGLQDRLVPFLRMIRQWRHLKTLKRAGRGHEEEGVRTIAPGQLCMRCPACPVPGFNLPANWNEVSDDLRYAFDLIQLPATTAQRLHRYIYTMMLSLDANFRLKRRAVSNDARDPGLINGGGYFVENRGYHEHILKHANQEDVGCS